MTISTERFIVLCGTSIEPWVANDEIFKSDRFNVIKNIAAGEYSGVGQIIALDLANGTCRDATKEIAREVMDRWAHDGECLSDLQRHFVEMHISLQAANSFARAA